MLRSDYLLVSPHHRVLPDEYHSRGVEPYGLRATRARLPSSSRRGIRSDLHRELPWDPRRAARFSGGALRTTGFASSVAHLGPGRRSTALRVAPSGALSGTSVGEGHVPRPELFPDHAQSPR